MTKIYLWSKKIHRILVIVIIFITIIMAGTGIFLKYSATFSRVSFIDLGLVRYIHNNLSVLFATILFLMIVTGAMMYVYPWYVQRKNKKENHI